MPCNGESTGWPGDAAPHRLPPEAYWRHLERLFPLELVGKLQAASDDRHLELTAGVLFGPAEQEAGARLLAAFAADGWARCEATYRCAECEAALELADYEDGLCRECGQDLVVEELIYERQLPEPHMVEWAVVIHGMNTDGAWQEEFSWFFSSGQGRSVPVAVYKYGWITTGVILGWRREKLKRDLRRKLLMLQRQARSCGIVEPPDLVAHSFGTWLLGHLLLDELEHGELRLGRIILTGCVLRPDFPWHAVKQAGLVQQVLNHYGTRDPVVPWAHWTIRDSGPSGRRGFDPDPDSGELEVLNLAAEGYGHSDLFSVNRCVVDGRPLQSCPEDGSGTRHLEHTFTRYWRPFLTRPAEELAGLLDRADPEEPWREAWWPLQGALFPFVALPFLAALALAVLAMLGGWLQGWTRPLWIAGGWLLGAVVVLLAPAIGGMLRRG